MTLVVCWTQGQACHCLADSRLSFDRRLPGIGANIGSKIAILPIAIHEARSETEHNYECIFKHSVGFAYSGSSLIASTTFLRASSIAQILRSNKDESQILLSEIADLVAKVAEKHSKELKAVQPNSELAEIVLFGFCPSKKKAEVYRIFPETSDESFSMIVKEEQASSTRPLVIGSGKPLFERIAGTLAEAGIFRDINEVFARTIRHNEAQTYHIGGLPECATASPIGAQLEMVMFWDGDDNGDLQKGIHGLEVEKQIGQVGSLGIGYKMIELDSNYRIGEQLLRKNDINEQDIAKRESLRDIAVISYMVDLWEKLSSGNDQKVYPGNFYMSEFEAAPGGWVYGTKCSGCSNDVALFSDSSEGKVKPPMIGANLISQCEHCGAQTSVQSALVKSFKWPKQIGHAILR